MQNIHGQQIPAFYKVPRETRREGTYGKIEYNDQAKAGLIAFDYRGIEGAEYPDQYHCRIMVDPLAPASFWVIRSIDDEGKEIPGFEGSRFTSINKAKDAWDNHVRGKTGYPSVVE